MVGNNIHFLKLGGDARHATGLEPRKGGLKGFFTFCESQKHLIEERAR
jgi:hypothetical protein